MKRHTVLLLGVAMLVGAHAPAAGGAPALPDALTKETCKEGGFDEALRNQGQCIKAAELIEDATAACADGRSPECEAAIKKAADSLTAETISFLNAAVGVTGVKIDCTGAGDVSECTIDWEEI